MFSTTPRTGDADPLEHLRAAQGIAHRHFLRCGDDDRGTDVHRLGERELRVARPRRQVHQKVVQLAPVNVLHELSDHLHDDGPAPDRRRVPFDDERERHELHAVGSSGWIFPPRTSGFWSAPIIRGMFGP